MGRSTTEERGFRETSENTPSPTLGEVRFLSMRWNPPGGIMLMVSTRRGETQVGLVRRKLLCQRLKRTTRHWCAAS